MKRTVLISSLIFGLTTSLAQAASGAPKIPDLVATPGSINPSVSQGNIASTICTLGYTAKIRPSSSYTTKLKIKQLSTVPYSSYGSKNTSLFEEDHLIPLELGGNPTDPKNLWPEPWDGLYGARIKDKLENKLHAMVCAHQITLVEAQTAFATNWYLAYQNYLLAPSPKSSIMPTVTPKPQKFL